MGRRAASMVLTAIVCLIYVAAAADDTAATAGAAANRPQTLTLNHPNNNGEKGLEEEARVKGWGLLSDCRYSDS